MPRSFGHLPPHVVFSTKRRLPRIESEWSPLLAFAFAELGIARAFRSQPPSPLRA